MTSTYVESTVKQINRRMKGTEKFWSNGAEAMLTLAEADRKVVEAQNRANADVLKQQVSVYGDEADFIRAKLYEKTAPNVQSVLATDENGAHFGLPVGGRPTVKAEKAAPATKVAPPPKPTPPPEDSTKKGGTAP